MVIGSKSFKFSSMKWWSSLACLGSWGLGRRWGQEGNHAVKSEFATLTQQRCPPLFGDTVFPQYPQEIGFKPAHTCMTKSTDAQVPYVDVGLAKAGYRVTVLISHVRLHLKRHSLTKINFKGGNHGRNIILMTASFLFETKIASLVYNYKRDTCTFSKIQAIQKCKN